MKTTKEKIAVMEAFERGEEIIVSSGVKFKKSDGEQLWDWHHFDFDVVKTPTLRPWKPEEVPVGAVLRSRWGQEFIIMSRESLSWPAGYVQISEPNKVMGGWQVFDTKNCDYSTDCCKTWQPCGVLE